MTVTKPLTPSDVADSAEKAAQSTSEFIEAFNKPIPKPQARLIAVSVVDAEEGMGVIKQNEKPKPKPRDREKTHVTNTAFRDSEPLRELQRQLHRAENKKGKA